MMSALIARAESVARAAQRRRLEEISASLRDIGVSAEAGSDSIALRGKQLVQRWLADPMLRFIGMSRP